MATLRGDRALRTAAAGLGAVLEQLVVGEPGTLDHIEQASQAHADARRAARPQLLERTARGELAPADAERRLEAWRWIDRIGYHLWRAFHHLEEADRPLPNPEPPAPAVEGRRGDESYDVRR